MIAYAMGHYIYFNPENDRDKGTIFDFIQNRRSGQTFSMSYAKKVIYDFDGNLKKNYIQPSGVKLLPRSNKDDYSKVQAYFKKLPALNNTEFLESRGISKELLYSSLSLSFDRPTSMLPIIAVTGVFSSCDA